MNRAGWLLHLEIFHQLLPRPDRDSDGVGTVVESFARHDGVLFTFFDDGELVSSRGTLRKRYVPLGADIAMGGSEPSAGSGMSATNLLPKGSSPLRSVPETSATAELTPIVSTPTGDPLRRSSMRPSNSTGPSRSDLM